MRILESYLCFNVNNIPVENKTPWDFDVVTKNYPLKINVNGLRYNIDALGIIKTELIK